MPAFRIAYYEPKVKQQYKFRYAKDKNRYIFTAEYDETDYSWHYYKFELSHVMLFPFLLSNLERLHLREYGIYPIKRPVKQVENTESGESGSSGSGNTSTDDYKPQGYLGVVNEKAEKYSNRIKTLKTGNREVLASSGEFFLMAINCKAFKAGFLYKWDGKEWNELSPFIKYPRECKDAFDDIKELSHLSQAGFYKEFASFGVAICSGLFSSSIMTDALSVIGDITLMNLPNYDPHKRGALFRRGSRLYISTG